MTSNPSRGGHRWDQVKADFRTRCQEKKLPCHLCNQPIDYDAQPQQADAFEADHHKPVASHPDLAYQMGNLRPSHSSCNRSRGSKPIPQSEWIAADW